MSPPLLTSHDMISHTFSPGFLSASSCLSGTTGSRSGGSGLWFLARWREQTPVGDSRSSCTNSRRLGAPGVLRLRECFKIPVERPGSQPRSLAHSCLLHWRCGIVNACHPEMITDCARVNTFVLARFLERLQ